MRRFSLTILLILLAYSLFSVVEYYKLSDGIGVTFTNDDPKMELAELTKILAFPSKNVEIVINECEIAEYNSSGDLLRTINTDGSSSMEIKKSFTMRELYAHQIKLNIIQNSELHTKILQKLDFALKATEPIEVSQKISSVFYPIYKSMVDNFETSYLRDAELSPAKMLIITHQSLLANMQIFVDWKNQKGIQTQVVTKEEIGTTNAQIKAYIQDLYQTSENPPDYVLLTGDVDDLFEIPAFFISSTGEIDVTDHPYTLLEGDDYFPEMIIGRMSFDSITELQTMIAKTLFYEKTPFMDSTHWFENATLVAGNFSSSPPVPSTPVKVTKWLRDKMYNYGYNDIDEIYYPPTYPGTSLISNSINEGVGVVSYRGWGDANGWHYPYFHTDDLAALNNGLMLPIITSFVCNTGDFANSVDPCFGEAWLRLGNPSNPKGGVVFVGPSDLHTSTKYNNSLFSGFWYGVLDEANLNFGSAILRGKYELYDNFPLNTGYGDYVEFYFNVYNILGDPSLTIWTTVPQEIICSIPAEVNIGTNYLELDLPDMEGAIVTAIKDDEFYSTAVVENGSALVFLESESEGEILLTITKPNYHPLQEVIDLVQNDVDLGLVDVIPAGELVAGTTVQLDITIKNYGTQTASSVSADLTTNNENVNVITTSGDFGDITAGSTANQSYDVELLANCNDNEILEFDLALSDGSNAKFHLIASGLVFEFESVLVSDENGILEPNEQSVISVSMKNIGAFTALDIEAELIALNDKVDLIISNMNLGDVNAGGTVSADFTVHAAENCYVGINVPFQLDLVDIAGLTTSIYFSLEIGDVSPNAPTGPDSFGYYAYDSSDEFYVNCPEFNWIEIDPLEGGEGQVFTLGDDRSETIAMAFDFPFYGQVSDSLTICTNGWISFQPTWETYFRNWNIPSALGPYAMIAPYWDDLIGELEGDTHAEMRISYYYDENENLFIIEWNKCVNRYDNTSPEKFEIILFDPAYYPTSDGNGEIQFNYLTVNNPDASSNYATVGIENYDQSGGLLYTYANIYPPSAIQFQNEFSIKFTTQEPEFTDPAVPSADFSVESVSGIAPFEVEFTNLTTPHYFYNEYLWDFGDGSSESVELHPVHVYNDIGNFDVALTAENILGSNEIVKTGFINVFSADNLIWPGDTNNDGIVDIEDIFAIGMYWRQTGNPRNNASFTWQGNDYPEGWDIDVASLADCNGDGEVNISDVLAIGLNWGSTHVQLMAIPPFSSSELETQRNNFEEIYNDLGNNGIELELKNYLALLFNLPIVDQVEINNLKQNYPNPFNPETNIFYSISNTGFIELSVYNVKGQLVKKLVNDTQSPGEYSVVWNGEDTSASKVSSGLYLYKLKVNGKTVNVKKMMLLK